MPQPQIIDLEEGQYSVVNDKIDLDLSPQSIQDSMEKLRIFSQ